jgi:protein-tyrosine phosphatase
VHAVSTRVYRPVAHCRGYTWIGDERIAIGALPCGPEMAALPGEGVTHVVNCRARLQTVISQDLALERIEFGSDRVVNASMWDNGKLKEPYRWSHAAEFATGVLDRDPDAQVLIHCQQGRRRSVMVAYAVLRMRGYSPEDAARLVLEYREVARLVPSYRVSVERWLARRAIR